MVPPIGPAPPQAKLAHGPPRSTRSAEPRLLFGVHAVAPSKESGFPQNSRPPIIANDTRYPPGAGRQGCSRFPAVESVPRVALNGQTHDPRDRTRERDDRPARNGPACSPFRRRVAVVYAGGVSSLSVAARSGAWLDGAAWPITATSAARSATEREAIAAANAASASLGRSSLGIGPTAAALVAEPSIGESAVDPSPAFAFSVSLVQTLVQTASAIVVSPCGLSVRTTSRCIRNAGVGVTTPTSPPAGFKRDLLTALVNESFLLSP